MNEGNETSLEVIGDNSNIVNFPSHSKLSGNTSAPQGALAQLAGLAASLQQETEMANLTREEHDAKIERSEALVDTKLIRLEGKIDLLESKLTSQLSSISSQLIDMKEQIRDGKEAVKENRKSIRDDTVVATFSILLLIVAIVSFIPSFFDMGNKIRDWIGEEVKAHYSDQKK